MRTKVTILETERLEQSEEALAAVLAFRRYLREVDDHLAAIGRQIRVANARLEEVTVKNRAA